jgi:hypothetical protein
LSSGIGDISWRIQCDILEINKDTAGVSTLLNPESDTAGKRQGQVRSALDITLVDDFLERNVVIPVWNQCLSLEQGFAIIGSDIKGPYLDTQFGAGSIGEMMHITDRNSQPDKH